jgi:hypothetical protein
LSKTAMPIYQCRFKQEQQNDGGERQLFDINAFGILLHSSLNASLSVLFKKPIMKIDKSWFHSPPLPLSPSPQK